MNDVVFKYKSIYNRSLTNNYFLSNFISDLYNKNI